MGEISRGKERKVEDPRIFRSRYKKTFGFLFNYFYQCTFLCTFYVLFDVFYEEQRSGKHEEQPMLNQLSEIK